MNMEHGRFMMNDWCQMKLTSGTQWYKDKIKSLASDNGLEYEPIPMDDIILLVNGFEKDPFYPLWKLRLDDGSELFVEHNHVYVKHYSAYPYDLRGVSTKYVHELQRALRYCCLWELADNLVA